jgi:hypothetical protein
MEPGLIRQSSFPFTVACDDWDVDDSGISSHDLGGRRALRRDHRSIGGAYPQTSAAMARSRRAKLNTRELSWAAGLKLLKAHFRAAVRRARVTRVRQRTYQGGLEDLVPEAALLRDAQRCSALI